MSYLMTLKPTHKREKGTNLPSVETQALAAVGDSPSPSHY